MKQLNLVMEYFWLAVSIITGSIAIYSFFSPKVDELLHPLYYVLPLVAFGLFYMRRRFRLRMQKRDEERGDKMDQ
ncbi:hypothetical protein KFE98_06270 [bacterium SCSIO 12741]|nr:hypothetical protein KFE98_06270 [bacterium SCSIO 12741]